MILTDTDIRYLQKSRYNGFSNILVIRYAIPKLQAGRLHLRDYPHDRLHLRDYPHKSPDYRQSQWHEDRVHTLVMVLRGRPWMIWGGRGNFRNEFIYSREPLPYKKIFSLDFLRPHSQITNGRPLSSKLGKSPNIHRYMPEGSGMR